MNTSQQPHPVVQFQFEQQEVRVIQDEAGEPWFVAKDVCQVLDVSNVTAAVEGLDEDEKGLGKVYTLGGPQDMVTITESGLYTLIIRSNKPQAKPFRRWVTHEVLPSIRKTGGYVMPEAEDEDPVEELARRVRAKVAAAGLGIGHQINLHQIALKLLDRGGNALAVHLQNVEALCGALDESVGKGRRLLRAATADNLVETFIDECCFADEEACTPATVLYRAFRQWLERRNLPNTLSQKRFGAALGAAGFSRSKTGISSYRGLALRETAIQVTGGAA
jgi:prophage antirepressor-like protein